IKQAQQMGAKNKVAVVMGADSEVIEACREAYEKNMVIPIFIDNVEKIKELGGDFEGAEIIEASSEVEAAKIGVELVTKNQAQMLMKGKIKTSTFLKAVVNKETGITGKNILSHILMFESYNKLRMVTDGGMIINPDLNQKISIIENAVSIFRNVGVEKPKV